MLNKFLLVDGIKMTGEGLGSDCINLRFAGYWSVSKFERLVLFLVSCLERELLGLIMTHSTTIVNKKFYLP